MPIAPVNRRIRRPALSMIKHAKPVLTNWITPRAMLTSLPSLKPARAKMLAALKRIGLIPQNCWKTINPMLIIRGLAITGDSHSRNDSFS